MGDESYLQLCHVGRFSIERWLFVFVVDLFQIALNEKLLHDLLSGLNIDWPWLGRVGYISGMQHRLQQRFGIGHRCTGIALFEKEVRGHALDQRGMIGHVRRQYERDDQRPECSILVGGEIRPEIEAFIAEKLEDGTRMMIF